MIFGRNYVARFFSAVIIISSQKVLIMICRIFLTKRYIELRKQEFLALAETILSELPVSNVVM